MSERVVQQCLLCGEIWIALPDRKHRCTCGVTWTAGGSQVWPPRWIPVEERTPKIGPDSREQAQCLAWVVMDSGAEFWRDETWAHWVNSAGRAWTGWLNEPPDGRYTHWMDAPKGPEDD